LLAGLRTSGLFIPISLAEDLLCLDLGLDEKQAILEATGSHDGRALEHFLTANLLAWPQDLAATAVRHWAHHTDHLLWFRVMAALRSPHLPQRVFYTIIDEAHAAGGARAIAQAADAFGLEEMSEALLGLLLHRATQCSAEHPRLTALAERLATDLAIHPHPGNKALPSALAYLARFAPTSFRALLDKKRTTEPWRDFIRAALAQMEQAYKQDEKIARFALKPPKTQALAKLEALWPPLWSRSAMTETTLAAALTLVLSDTASGQPVPWELFASIPETRLVKALACLPDDLLLARATALLGGFLSQAPGDSELLTLLKSRIAQAADPSAVLALLPPCTRLELTQGELAAQTTGKLDVFALFKLEENDTLAGAPTPRLAACSDYVQIQDGRRCYTSAHEDLAELASRKAFFDVAYRGAAVSATTDTGGFFGLLLSAWTTPTEAKLASLAQAARQVTGVFRLCYLNTLGRFKGYDQAALKILDFIRSKEEDDLRAIINALGDIGTPRATQELVASLTRPNITPTLQLETSAVLRKADLTNLQNELRSAINDLTAKEDADTALEVRDAIADLLDPTEAAQGITEPLVTSSMASDRQLDHALSGKIQNYRELSSEVKRALRTSQFFHMQVSVESAPASIDLSPVIDMQYKALELLFRETYEEACSRVIHRGILQRRLDVIGYARPIPRNMDEFESYVASLPIVREIPFFSKFKLRKMLRAICQFRPGKRFTLDGLKAFALFFLCFGRSECRYGLAGLFPLGLAGERELYEFVKQLHVLQDFRNRAAHEGFHPDASSDIDGIWRTTAEIIQTMFKTKSQVEQILTADFSTPRSRPEPIIEKKVS